MGTHWSCKLRNVGKMKRQLCPCRWVKRSVRVSLFPPANKSTVYSSLSRFSQAHRSQPQRAESLAGRFLHRSPGEAPTPSSLSPSMSPAPQLPLPEGETCPFSASVEGPASLGTLRWVPKKKSQCTLRWWGMSSGEEGDVEGA